MNLALGDAELKPLDRLVVCILATHTYGNGSCTATWAQLQEWTGLCRTSVYNHMGVLADRGWIAPLPRRSDNGRQAPNLYLLTCGQPVDEAVDNPVDNNPKPKVQGSRGEPHRVHVVNAGEHDQGSPREPLIERTKYLEVNPSTPAPEKVADFVRAVAARTRLR